MSLHDDILATVNDLIRRNKEIIAYSGTVSAIDATNVAVIVDGAQALTPCVPLKHMDIAIGDRVTILNAGGRWFVLGVQAFKRVVSLPSYTGTHPTGTVEGDMWYRSDLAHAYVNKAGTPTQLDN